MIVESLEVRGEIASDGEKHKDIRSGICEFIEGARGLLRHFLRVSEKMSNFVRHNTEYL